MSVEGGPPNGLTIGAVLIGFTMSLLIYGISTGQAILYVRRYGRVYSTFWTHCFVIALWVIDTVHVFCLSSAMYYYCVYFHGDSSQFTRVVWPYGSIAVSAECATVLVRLGYAYRIWKLSNRRAILPIVIVVLSFVVLMMGIVFGIKELKIHSFDQIANYQWSFYIVFVVNLVTDIIVATAMLIVFKGLWTGLKRFDAIIQIIMVYIVNTGVLSVILTTSSMIAFLVLPETFIYNGLYWLLAKMHVCSFLAVLHAEKELAERASMHSTNETPMFTTALRVEGEFTGLPTQTETTELSDLSAPGSSRLEPEWSGSERSRRSREPKVRSISFVV